MLAISMSTPPVICGNGGCTSAEDALPRSCPGAYALKKDSGVSKRRSSPILFPRKTRAWILSWQNQGVMMDN